MGGPTIKVAAVLLSTCALCGCEEAPAPRTIVDARGALDELYLRVSSADGVSTRPLLAGVAYQVVIEGTVSLWHAEHWSSVCAGTPWFAPQIPSPGPTGPVGVDAEWVWAWPTASSLCTNGRRSGPVPHAQRRVLIQTKRGAPAEHLPPPLQTSMSPDHVYTYAITGTGTRLTFRVDDAPLEDNYGELRILIFPGAVSAKGQS